MKVPVIANRPARISQSAAQLAVSQSVNQLSIYSISTQSVMKTLTQSYSLASHRINRATGIRVRKSARYFID